MQSLPLDWSLARQEPPPFAHQIVDAQRVVDQRAYGLMLEMGLGKSRIVTDAACWLYRQDQIDALLIVCPAPVRSIWASDDPILGEFVKWVWSSVPYDLREYHAKRPLPVTTPKTLSVVVTNPDFVRRPERLAPLLQWIERRRVMLVVDESWQYANPRSQQTKALVKIGHACTRAYLLNGTPGAPEQVYSQLQILPVNIFDCRNYFAWRARYVVMGGWQQKNIVGYRNMDDFNRRTAPYVVRRLTRDCLDLPPVSHTQIEARLTPETWRHYRAMRDDLITWLSQNEASTAAQAGVRVMRLAQITAGLLGGVEAQADLLDELPAGPPQPVREIGREKLDALIDWLQTHWDSPKLIAWGRFRREIERTAEALANTAFCLQTVRPSVRTLYGGQTAEERAEVKALLAPGGRPDPAIVVGSAAAGGAGLNFAAAHVAVYLTNSFSLKDRLQSEGRLDRPGQTRPVTYLDILATGPNGERTIDHTIVAALRRKQDLSDLTASAWRDVLVGGEQQQKEAA